MFKNNDKIDYSMVKSDDVYVQDALKTSDPRYKYCPSDEEYDEAIKSFGSPDNITEDEKDGVRYGTDPIQASVDTVASDGIGQNEFQLEMSKLEQWLSDIGAAESYDDIKDDILSGTETTIHLSQPISTVTLVMPKPKH